MTVCLVLFSLTIDSKFSHMIFLPPSPGYHHGMWSVFFLVHWQQYTVFVELHPWLVFHIKNEHFRVWNQRGQLHHCWCTLKIRPNWYKMLLTELLNDSDHLADPEDHLLGDTTSTRAVALTLHWTCDEGPATPNQVSSMGGHEPSPVKQGWWWQTKLIRTLLWLVQKTIRTNWPLQKWFQIT